jgi:hypothetical protein
MKATSKGMASKLTQYYHNRQNLWHRDHSVLQEVRVEFSVIYDIVEYTFSSRCMFRRSPWISQDPNNAVLTLEIISAPKLNDNPHLNERASRCDKQKNIFRKCFLLFPSKTVIIPSAFQNGERQITQNRNFDMYDDVDGARGSVVGWGTMLQAGRSRVRFPMRSLDFSIDLIFQPHYGRGVDSASNRNAYQESSWG